MLLLAGLITTIAAHAASAAGRVALVIGNSNYEHIARLANPTNDADLIAAVLREAGFELVGGRAHLDLDKQAFEQAIVEFGAAIEGAEAALFYYAGHGIQIRDRNYLIPVGANPRREADADFQMLNAELVLRQMEASGAKLNVMILDSCRNNPFGGRGFRSAAAGLAQMQAPQGTLISFATQPGNVAADGDGINSPFTKALADKMLEPGLDILRMFNDVGVAVSAATGGNQQPWMSSSPIKGEFYFAGKREAPVEEQAAPEAPVVHDLVAKAPPDLVLKAPPVDPCQSAETHWKATDALDTEAAYRDHLRQFSACRFAELAREKMRKLQQKVAMGRIPQPAPRVAQGPLPGTEFRDCAQCPLMVVLPARGGQFPLAVGKFEVTGAEWNACVRDGACSGEQSPESHPANFLFKSEMEKFVAWLGRKTGKRYRLPSKSEWEYAARANSTSTFFFGDDAGKLDKYAWYIINSGGLQTNPVGKKLPNAFGLHDVYGNVSERVVEELLCGGGAMSFPQGGSKNCFEDIGLRTRDIGFRVVKTLN
ncbi:MAG: hypothetical protein BroJett030_29440 [Alphaproteobacteria bacterium]|nr:MAG: hypothetical protein BroJett030_29440 [Alphaproteobacteria bacterium]